MLLADIYKSLQGEGFLTGTESIFIRASGCNLRCGYCDTPYASWTPGGQQWTVEAILKRCASLQCTHVVYTGGEPMMFPESIALCAALRERGYHITVETAGTRLLPLECDLASISPKMSNSTPEVASGFTAEQRDRHERRRYAPDVIRQLVAMYQYQFKFVVGSLADCEEAARYLDVFPEIDRSRVMLMPLAADHESLDLVGAWLEPYCQQVGLRFCPRKHIEWFGTGRRT